MGVAGRHLDLPVNYASQPPHIPPFQTIKTVNHYLTLEEADSARSSVESVGSFSQRVKDIASSSWRSRGISFTDVSVADHSMIPEFSIPNLRDRNGYSREFHHIIPKTFARTIAQFDDSYERARIYFPSDLLAQIILDNPHHPLNCLPIDMDSHTFMHYPPYIKEYWQMSHDLWVSMVQNGEDPIGIPDCSSKRSFRQYASVFGIPDWYHRLDDIFFACNVILLREKYFKGNKPKLKMKPIMLEQYFQDINDVYFDLLTYKPGLMMDTTKMLVDAGMMKSPFRREP